VIVPFGSVLDAQVPVPVPNGRSGPQSRPGRAAVDSRRNIKPVILDAGLVPS